MNAPNPATRIFGNIAGHDTQSQDESIETGNENVEERKSETGGPRTLPSSYCTQCGSVVVPGTTFCDKCGLRTDDRSRAASAMRIADEIACPFCKEQIRIDAIKCKHCGEFLNSQLRQTRVAECQSQPSRGVAAVLSLIIPGAGQMYRGDIASGLLWLIGTVIGYCVFIIPGLILHFCCVVKAGTD